MLRNLVDDPENKNYNILCNYAFHEYTGKKQCLYNIARSMAETYQYLKTEVSSEISDWEWKNVHVNEYPNMPWSLTPLKFLFHREVAIGGNGNTVKVSKYSLNKVMKHKQFKAFHTPNYKQVVSFANDAFDNVMLYSFDGGQSGNLFAGHYFDFNAAHSSGKLMKAAIGKASVEQLSHTKLVIKPEALRVEDLKA